MTVAVAVAEAVMSDYTGASATLWLPKELKFDKETTPIHPFQLSSSSRIHHNVENPVKQKTPPAQHSQILGNFPSPNSCQVIDAIRQKHGWSGQLRTEQKWTSEVASGKPLGIKIKTSQCPIPFKS
ncbi:hypothetical protein V6N12_029269 [Hibiscus sabdariffa]|uniref:Uncharacterized protein n=1 Tax=Hibiscus sabdariffa TaxID=183260 RepID=A0ABR2CVK9_9ROSI